MHQPRTRALLPALALVLGLACAGTTVSPGADAAQPSDTAARVAEPRVSRLAPVRLDRNLRGTAALRALGDRLGDAARQGGRRPAELRALLQDPTTWLDEEARPYVTDTELTAGTSDAAATSEAATSEATPYPTGATFALHSRPGSKRTIFLDFDGHTVSGTAWNSSRGVTTAPLPAWSLDDSAAFSDTERAAIQSIWQRVAEDYAPFDVDVTTQDPGEAAIARTSSADDVFGTRALITPSSQASTAICGSGGCGGVAYVDVFDALGSSHDKLQPAFVFPHMLGNDTKNIAEAISHEVGHNLGLSHDGRTASGSRKAEEYYSGHTFWAPIMGAGYSAALTQWSRGSYASASNTQDDLAVITSSGLSSRADEAGGTVASAAGLPEGPAYVATTDDVDVFALGTCTGTVAVAGLNAPTSPDLDLRLRLLDADGAVLATADPTSAVGSPRRDVTTGTDATVTASGVSGPTFVEVDGVGNGPWTTQYDDYGSLGAYTLARSGSCVEDAGRDTTEPETEPEPEPQAEAPSAPRSLSVTAQPLQGTADLTWLEPGADGGSPRTAYRLTVDGVARDLAAGWTGVRISGLTRGVAHTLSLEAVNAVGTGPAASATATLAGAPPAPAAVGLTTVSRRGTVTWTAPAGYDAALLTGWRLRLVVDGRLRATSISSTPTLRSFSYAALPAGAVRVEVAAVSGTLTGPATGSGIRRIGGRTLPRAPRIRAVFAGSQGGPVTAGVRWSAPTGAPVTGYRVVVYRLGPGGQRAVVPHRTAVLDPGQRSAELRLSGTRFRFAVQARGEDGFGPLSPASPAVRAR